MKKLISKLSAVALLAALVVVPNSQAASINPTASVVSGVGAINDTITITSATNFPVGDDIASATIKTLAGVAVAGTTFTYGAGADDTSVLTIAGAGLTNNTAYILTFRTTSGDFGSIQVNVGTPTNNQVAVSATVEPTLSFSIGGGSHDGNTTLAFGSLTVDTFAADDLELTYATNAVSGLTISVAAGGLTDVEEIGSNLNGNAADDTDATDYYKISTAGDVNAVTFDTVAGLIDNVGGANMDTDQYVVTETAAVSSTQFVTVGTQVAATTPAGNYTDTLTFSATATF